MCVVLSESDIARVWPSIISTTLGADLPPTALHDTVRSWPSVPNNMFSGLTFSILKL
jgi:hypothetical protein